MGHIAPIDGGCRYRLWDQGSPGPFQAPVLEYFDRDPSTFRLDPWEISTFFFAVSDANAAFPLPRDESRFGPDTRANEDSLSPSLEARSTLFGTSSPWVVRVREELVRNSAFTAYSAARLRAAGLLADLVGDDALSLAATLQQWTAGQDVCVMFDTVGMSLAVIPAGIAGFHNIPTSVVAGAPIRRLPPEFVPIQLEDTECPPGQCPVVIRGEPRAQMIMDSAVDFANRAVPDPSTYDEAEIAARNMRWAEAFVGAVKVACGGGGPRWCGFTAIDLRVLADRTAYTVREVGRPTVRLLGDPQYFERNEPFVWGCGRCP